MSWSFASRWLVVNVSLLLACGLQAQSVQVDTKEPVPTDARLRIGSYRFREAVGYVSGVSVSPDGKILTIGSQGQTIRLLDMATGKELRRFSTRNSLRSNQIPFTPDGKFLLLHTYDGIGLYKVEDGSQHKMYSTGQNRDGAVSFSADLKYFAHGQPQHGNAQCTVLVNEFESGKQVASLSVVQNAYVQSTFSKDAKILVTYGQHYNRGGNDENLNGVLQLWDVATGKELHQLKTGSSSNITSVAFSPDQKKLLVGGYGHLQLWDVATAKLERRFACRNGQGQTVAFSPDGKKIVATSQRDSVIQMWDTETGKRLGMCDGPSATAMGVQFLQDGRCLAWGMQGACIHVWEVPSGKRLTPEGGHSSAINGLYFEDNQTLLTSSTDNRYLRWNIHNGKELKPLSLRIDEESRRYYRYARPYYGNQGLMTASVFAPNGKYLISGNPDYGINNGVYELPQGVEIFSLITNVNGGYIDRNGAVIFSPDSTKVTILGRFMNRNNQSLGIPVWDLESGLLLEHSFKGNNGEMSAAGFSRDGKLLASASFQYTGGTQTSEIWIWDLATGRDLRKINHNTTCQAITFLDQRRFLAVHSNSCKVYDAITGQELGGFDGSIPQVTTPPVISPDGRLVAIGWSSQPRYNNRGMMEASTFKVMVWELASGSLRHEFAGHQGAITSLAFSPDGRVLASGSADTTILIWDLVGTPVNRTELKEPELQDLWKALDDPNGKKGETTLRTLAARPHETVPFLVKQLKPITGERADPEMIAKHIRNLDASRFLVRESASRDLERIGKQSLDPLRLALGNDPSPEMRDRIERLVFLLDKPESEVKWMRELRAIEVLERIGTNEAKEHLRTMANGTPSPPTKMAQEALKRLK